ncbi:hypothetical protein J3P77_09515 [Pseudomonas sp. R1-18]|uniref:DnaT-like ssDNA-binding domain-containing protein n=1 Tax=Pseudomonas sp. R1-18 TaxID=1632772 RepID=UPI003DA84A65
MAGDWIKFELTTMDKPEVCQLADLAAIDPDAVVGKLMRVWGWFDQQTESGNAPSVSKKLLDRSVGVTGFCDLMKSVGWMEEEDGFISLPHFDRHNGKTAKNRALTAKRVASHKTKGNAASVTSALPREEKRREDQHNTLREGAENSADPKAPCEMTLDWTPDDRVLAAYATRMGLATSLFTHEAIGAFVCHYAASGRFETPQAWASLLVKWVKRDCATLAGSNVRPFPIRQANGPDFDDTSWSTDLGVL